MGLGSGSGLGLGPSIGYSKVLAFLVWSAFRAAIKSLQSVVSANYSFIYNTQRQRRKSKKASGKLRAQKSRTKLVVWFGFVLASALSYI